MSDNDPTSSKPSWIDLQSIVSLKRASALNSLSPDSMKRNYPDKIVKLGPRREGMRLGDALFIAGDSN